MGLLGASVACGHRKPIEQPPTLRRIFSMVEGLERIEWLGHAGFRIKTPAGLLYVDPYRAPQGPPADVLLITHDHFDHFSPDDLRQLVNERTRVVAPATVTEQLKGAVLSIVPGET